MFLIEPHVHIPDDEPEIENPDPIDMYPAPQSRQQTHFTPRIIGFFIVEDIPPHKWNLRFQKFLAWGLSELNTNPNITFQQVLILFPARLIGTLKEFWDSLDEYRQQTFFNYTSFTAAMNEFTAIFGGQQGHRIDKVREQFFKLKCCSLFPKDLDKHY